MPARQAMPLPDAVSMEQGACLGIPALTAHRAVHVAGRPAGRVVLVHGGAGAVGLWAVHLARRAGATVIATIRSPEDAHAVVAAGAHHALPADHQLARQAHDLAPGGVDHIVDVAFGAHVDANAALLTNGGLIAAYASDARRPAIPFWPLVFRNARIFFLGSDDFPPAAKRRAALEITRVLAEGWPGCAIARRFSLDEIADAHEWVEQHPGQGRVVVVP